MDSPQPRRRGRRYSSWASSTWALPSLDFACWAKMSRIRAVRSMTLTLTMSSRARRWPGASSPSAITVSAPDSATMSASSAALPLPRKVAGSGWARRWRIPSSTSEPAVSASAASSRRLVSASSALPLVYRPARTTRSRRSWRYSTSETSSSSVESPATRRSAWRSARSYCSPSASEEKVVAWTEASPRERIRSVSGSRRGPTGAGSSAAGECSTAPVLPVLVPSTSRSESGSGWKAMGTIGALLWVG